MLVALGIFAAGFFGLFLAPLYRQRAAKLAIHDLKRSMPLSDAEIRADKDRLRAQNAIAIHRLETRLEESGLVAARQRVEINRRDAAISGLESEVGRLGTILDEHENARRVLEQTITERLPMVERRLSEAKELLSQRDKEIGIISHAADKNMRALEEAKQINTRQREDLHRLNATLATRQAHNRSSFADAGVETEISLRGEIEALRAKTRDQSELIERLKVGPPHSKGTTVSAVVDGKTGAADIGKLRIDLEEAQQALRQARGESQKGKESQTGLETELAAMKGEAERLRSELSRLKAALNVYETTDKQQQTSKETKVALKARVGSLETELNEQADTIRRLKAEIAAGNDKMARQAAHYVDVIRRLGGGTQPATSSPSRAGAQRAGVMDDTAKVSERRSSPMVDRLNAPRRDGHALPGHTQSAESARRAKPSVREEAKVSDFIKALGGQASARAPHDNQNQANNTSNTKVESAAIAASAQDSSSVAAQPTNTANDQAKAASARQRRPGLLERLSGSD